MPLIVAHDLETLQKSLVDLAMGGKTVVLVPTMGALHDGHISLVEQAKTHADCVMATIFVNPTQFGKDEDFDKYPRTLEADSKKLDRAGVSVLYAPSAEDMYPQGFSTSVSAGALGTILCGAFRPGHFDGVATVVTKLFLRTLPHVAIFGEKDYQQLCVLRRVASDLDLPVEIIGAPTLREADGLAMSSRNAYLTPEERSIASKLYSVLNQTAHRIQSGIAVAEAIADGMVLLSNHGFRVDYLALRDADTLDAMNEYRAPARLLAAAWLGKTRLIDNIAM